MLPSRYRQRQNIQSIATRFPNSQSLVAQRSPGEFERNKDQIFANSSPCPTMTTPSIQTFYTPGILPPHGNSGGVAQVVDGFTSSELSTSSPLLRDWKPDHDYAHVFISDISSGKGRIRFCGRLVSFQPAIIDNSTMHYSRPYHYLVIKDDTGAIGVSKDWTHGHPVIGRLTKKLDQTDASPHTRCKLRPRPTNHRVGDIRLRASFNP